MRPPPPNIPPDSPFLGAVFFFCGLFVSKACMAIFRFFWSFVGCGKNLDFFFQEGASPPWAAGPPPPTPPPLRGGPARARSFPLNLFCVLPGRGGAVIVPPARGFGAARVSAAPGVAFCFPPPFSHPRLPVFSLSVFFCSLGPLFFLNPTLPASDLIHDPAFSPGWLRERVRKPWAGSAFPSVIRFCSIDIRCPFFSSFLSFIFPFSPGLRNWPRVENKKNSLYFRPVPPSPNRRHCPHLTSVPPPPKMMPGKKRQPRPTTGGYPGPFRLPNRVVKKTANKLPNQKLLFGARQCRPSPARHPPPLFWMQSRNPPSSRPQRRCILRAGTTGPPRAMTDKNRCNSGGSPRFSGPGGPSQNCSLIFFPPPSNFFVFFLSLPETFLFQHLSISRPQTPLSRTRIILLRPCRPGLNPKGTVPRFSPPLPRLFCFPTISPFPPPIGAKIVPPPGVVRAVSSVPPNGCRKEWRAFRRAGGRSALPPSRNSSFFPPSPETGVVPPPEQHQCPVPLGTFFPPPCSVGGPPSKNRHAPGGGRNFLPRNQKLRPLPPPLLPFLPPSPPCSLPRPEKPALLPWVFFCTRSFGPIRGAAVVRSRPRRPAPRGPRDSCVAPPSQCPCSTAPPPSPPPRSPLAHVWVQAIVPSGAPERKKTRPPEFPFAIRIAGWCPPLWDR